MKVGKAAARLTSGQPLIARTGQDYYINTRQCNFVGACGLHAVDLSNMTLSSDNTLVTVHRYAT